MLCCSALHCTALLETLLVYFVVVPGIIASKRCNHVEIYHNEVHDGGALAVGIFLHRSSDSAKVYGKNDKSRGYSWRCVDSRDFRLIIHIYMSCPVSNLADISLPSAPLSDRSSSVSRGNPENNVYRMSDAGLAILESFDAEIYGNSFADVKYGIRISLGGGNNHVHDNVFDSCSDCELRLCIFTGGGGRGTKNVRCCIHPM